MTRATLSRRNGLALGLSALFHVVLVAVLLSGNYRPYDLPTPPSEPLFTFADVSKAKRLIGYEPKVSVAEGLKRFVEWMRAEKII